MKIRKIALLLAAATIFSMVGCGGSKTKNEEEAKQPQTEEITEAAEEDVSSEGEKENTLTLNEGKLIWATNAEFKPYEYIQNGEIVGIDAEIAEYIGESLGLEVVADNINFDSILYSVENKEADIGIAAITKNEERLKTVDFSISYVSDSGQVIMVKENSDIRTAEDLEGKKIGVLLGTVGYMYVKENLKTASAERYNTGGDAVIALIKNEVDAVIMDRKPAAEFAAQSNDVIVIDEPLTQEEEYAIAVNKDNKELLEKINEILTEMQQNGKLDEIKSKYYNI